VSGIIGTEERQSIRLQTSWQLFSGFADRSRVRQATYSYHSAQETAQYAERKVVEEVKFAWSSMTTSKQRMELLDNAVNIAGEVYDARKRLRDAGSETALNVLDAENEVYRARIDAASARYDYYLSVYRLLLAMGKLSAGSTAS
jgi:adhesin transport system outer membrane protein